MQRKRSREELITRTYLNQTEIGRLLCLHRDTAIRVYTIARRLDDEELGDMVIEPRKVRMTSVLKAAGISFETLRKQIREIREVKAA